MELNPEKILLYHKEIFSSLEKLTEGLEKVSS